MRKKLEIIDEREVLGKDFKIYGDIENPLFKASDIANWIDYAYKDKVKGTRNVNMMLKTLDAEEIIKAKIEGNNLATQVKHGGMRNNTECLFVTEDGLYEVLMQSRKPIAKRFKKEVKKILKTIRKTGGYISNSEMMVNTYFGALDDGHKAIIKGLFDNIEQQQKEIAIQKPKAEYFDKLVERSHLTNFRDTAKELGIKQNLMIAILIDKKIVYRDKSQNLKPYARFVEKEYFELKDFHRGNKTGVQTLITPNGKDYIAKVIKREEKQLA